MTMTDYQHHLQALHQQLVTSRQAMVEHLMDSGRTVPDQGFVKMLASCHLAIAAVEAVTRATGNLPDTFFDPAA